MENLPVKRKSESESERKSSIDSIICHQEMHMIFISMDIYEDKGKFALSHQHLLETFSHMSYEEKKRWKRWKTNSLSENKWGHLRKISK